MASATTDATSCAAEAAAIATAAGPAAKEVHDTVGNGTARHAVQCTEALPTSADWAKPLRAAAFRLLRRFGRTVGELITSPAAVAVYPACVTALGVYYGFKTLADQSVVASRVMSDGIVAGAHVHAQTLWDGGKEAADLGVGAVGSMAALGAAARLAARRATNWWSQ